jgi:hypothetical protein
MNSTRIDPGSIRQQSCTLGLGERTMRWLRLLNSIGSRHRVALPPRIRSSESREALTKKIISTPTSIQGKQ